MKKLLLLCLLLAVTGCATQPIHGNFQTVCDELVNMSVVDRASNMGANGPHYQKTYGIFYDPVSDALFTKTGSGQRDYILEGDLVRATFLIDNRKKQ